MSRERHLAAACSRVPDLTEKKTINDKKTFFSESLKPRPYKPVDFCVLGETGDLSRPLWSAKYAEKAPKQTARVYPRTPSRLDDLRHVTRVHTLMRASLDELASRSPAGFRCNGSHASDVTHCLWAVRAWPCCCPFVGSHRRISPFLSAEAKRFPVEPTPATSKSID